jgi:glycerol uptake facilitator-like aquaporin
MSASSSEEKPLIEANNLVSLPTWRIAANRVLRELLGVILVGIFAVHAQTFASKAGTIIPDSFQVGVAHFGTLFASLAWSLPSVAGLTSVHLLLASFLCWYDAIPGAMTSFPMLGWKSIVSNIAVLVTILVGFYVTGLIGVGIFEDAASAPPNADILFSLNKSSPNFNLGWVFVLELLGKFFIDVVLFVTISQNKIASAFLVALVYGVMVAVLGPITGGSLNAARSTGQYLAFRTYGNSVPAALATQIETVQWTYWVSEIVAPIVALVVVKYLVRMQAFTLFKKQAKVVKKG